MMKSILIFGSIFLVFEFSAESEATSVPALHHHGAVHTDTDENMKKKKKN